MRYQINATLSRLRLKVHAAGMLSMLGHSPTIVVRDFSGQATIPEDGAGAAVELTIKTSSLAVGDDVKEADRREIEHIMQTTVLAADAHPTITFASTEATGASAGAGSFRVTIAGTLTLRGVSHAERIEALVNVMGDRLTANGQCTLRQTDYGIAPVSIAGGAIKLKDEIDLAFDIVARAVPPA